MTAKRFIIDEYFGIGSVVIDTENENVRFKHENKLSMKQCCDLLNGLYEENQDLSTKKEDAEYELLHLKEKYEELLEENEQLKTELTELKASKEDNYNIDDGLW